MPVVRVAALVLILCSATLAHATSQRTFVASTGVDTNTTFNCSLVKPCRGFAAAIGVTSAKGEVIVLDSAGYGSIASITKSITITAPTGIYAGISVFAGDGITINAAPLTDTVVLRGLTINGQGGANGITINNALTVHVENCVIADMVGIGINQVKGLLEVKDTIIRNNGNIGVYVVGPAQANLDHVRLEANNTGLAAENGGIVAMQDSIVTGSPNIGVLANTPTAAGSSVTISRSLVSSNNYGIYVDGNSGQCCVAIAALSDSTISGNGVGVHVTSSGDIDRGQVHLKHNTVTGNGVGIEAVSRAQVWADGNYMAFNYSYDLESSGGDFATRDNNTIVSPHLGLVYHIGGQ
jgi:hypothetical protein